MAATLRGLGVKPCLVVHGAGGLDKFSLAGETLVAEVHAGNPALHRDSEDFGVSRRTH